jgi:cytochrome c
MSTSTQLLFGALIAAGALACKSTQPMPSGSLPAPDNIAAQIEAGAAVYVQNCAACHGDAGQGTSKGPGLVGEGALPLEPRSWQDRKQLFHTAMDVAAFATENMPPKASKRAAMAEADYWAVLAFALSANGVSLSQPVSPNNAASIVLHP